MKSLILIAPELFLAAVALLLILGEAFLANRRLWTTVTVVSLLAVTGYYAVFFFTNALPGVAGFGLTPMTTNGSWVQYPTLFNMISVDSMAIFFKIALVASVLIVIWLSNEYYEFDASIPMGLYCAQLLLATVGMLLLVGSTDLLMAIIALELLSITSFILTGFIMKRQSSSEGAIKFFLVGSLSAAIVLFGISYYYGYFGTTSLTPLLQFKLGGQSPDMALSAILVFLVAGIGFKLAMVPFHMWAPDAYEGAPTPITAFLSVAPKAAAVGFLLRMLGHHAELGLTPVLAVLAALTMTVGNLGALQQTNVKRLLAYSSVAQVGYILVALVAGVPLGIQAAMIYTFVYLFMNLGVFTVLIILANQSKSEEISTFAGLYHRSFGLSLILVIFLLSMSGIPPLAGFVGKFAIFAAVIKTPSLLWLGVVAVINSVISLFYYFRIVHQMFFQEPVGTTPAPRLSPALVACLVLSLAVTIGAGVLPDPLLGWVRNLLG